MNEQFDFAKALKLIKHGYKVQRAGWNGDDMYVQYIEGYMNDAVGNDMGGIILRHYALPRHAYILPWIGMKTVSGDFVPWIASQTDILAIDWQYYLG
jgi:hypothetical protein